MPSTSPILIKDKKSRVLILITDGEDHEGNPLEAANKAKEEGVKIYTIGIGQEGGAPIPDSEHGGFKKNAQGEMILTKIDEEVLQKIALTTGGSYVRSVTGDLDLEKIYQDIHKSVEEKELKSGKQKRFEERFQAVGNTSSAD
jgi:Ca-activated chloride channel family protein